MLKILLVCSAGMSTSFLVEKMKKSAEVRGIEAEVKLIYFYLGHKLNILKEL